MRGFKSHPLDETHNPMKGNSMQDETTPTTENVVGDQGAITAPTDPYAFLDGSSDDDVFDDDDGDDEDEDDEDDGF